MNERIEKLWDEAADSIAAIPNGRNNFWETQENFMEKFAELIIRECADVIAPMGDWCGGHGEPSMPSTMECAKRLKKHFGVEE